MSYRLARAQDMIRVRRGRTSNWLLYSSLVMFADVLHEVGIMSHDEVRMLMSDAEYVDLFKYVK